MNNIPKVLKFILCDLIFYKSNIWLFTVGFSTVQYLFPNLQMTVCVIGFKIIILYKNNNTLHITYIL